MDGTGPSRSNKSTASDSGKWMAGVTIGLAAWMIARSFLRPTTDPDRVPTILLASSLVMNSVSVLMEKTVSRFQTVMAALMGLIAVGAVLFDMFGPR